MEYTGFSATAGEVFCYRPRIVVQLERDGHLGGAPRPHPQTPPPPTPPSTRREQNSQQRELCSMTVGGGVVQGRARSAVAVFVALQHLAERPVGHSIGFLRDLILNAPPGETPCRCTGPDDLAHVPLPGGPFSVADGGEGRLVHARLRHGHGECRDPSLRHARSAAPPPGVRSWSTPPEKAPRTAGAGSSRSTGPARHAKHQRGPVADGPGDRTPGDRWCF